MLRLRELRAWYGRIQALFDVSLSLDPGECLALVGTNGSGKTTIVRSLLGLIRTEGEIRLDGQDLSRIATHQRVRRHRIGVVHEGRGLFLRMSVLENILVGRPAGERSRVDTALALFPALANRLHQPAGLLSGGEQQMVALARAVVLQPRVLLLDEPTLGLAPVVIEEIYGYLAKLRETGLTMLLVEQSVRRASAFADRLCLIRSGRSVMTADGRNPAAEAELVRLAFAEADRPDERGGDER